MGNIVITNQTSNSPGFLNSRNFEPTLLGSIRNARVNPPAFFDRDENLVVLDFIDIPGSLFYLEDNVEQLEQIEQVRLDDEIKNVYFGSENEIFLISYENAPSELRWTNDHEKIVLLNGIVDKVYFSPNRNFFIVYYDDNYFELWNIDSFNVDQGLRNRDSFQAEIKQIDFDTSGNSFLISYESPTYNGNLFIFDEISQTFQSEILDSGVAYSSVSPNGEYIVLDFYETVGEIRRFTDGNIIASLKNEIDIERGIEFSPDSAWFILHTQTDRSELWNTKLGALLLDLDIGLASYDFITNYNLLILHYEGGQTYILDLAWLETISEHGDSLDLSELVQQVCQNLLSSDWFNEEHLLPFLGEKNLQACPAN